MFFSLIHVCFQLVKSKTGPGRELESALWHSGNIPDQVNIKLIYGILYCILLNFLYDIVLN